LNLLYPKFNWGLFPKMLGVALIGALIAGCYGVIHDQITYSISEEYFAKMKFEQFGYADFGFPVRIFVGEIGFLATWWVGFFAGWFLARIAFPVWPAHLAFRKSVSAFSIILISALVAGIIAYVLGINHSGDYSFWLPLCEELGISDVPAFVRVAYIHNASYIGGLLGLILAIVYLLRQKSWQLRADETSAISPKSKIGR
jgi:hypothetical protein